MLSYNMSNHHTPTVVILRTYIFNILHLYFHLPINWSGNCWLQSTIATGNTVVWCPLSAYYIEHFLHKFPTEIADIMCYIVFTKHIVGLMLVFSCSLNKTHLYAAAHQYSYAIAVCSISLTICLMLCVCQQFAY